MLVQQKKYLDYLNELERRCQTIEISQSIYDSIYNLKRVVTETELLIPVIGAFSAGKSSLINSFLEKDILPVGITPETAIATELRYCDAESERIEAVIDDNSFDTYNLYEIGNTGKKAQNYRYIRLFISNKKLKEIQPLVLVDMPGFDSPFDLHHRAIMEYLNKGVHYIVLISVEEGTITKTMERQLKDIQEYKRDFSFFLSKSNLRSPEEVEDIKNNIEELIYDQLDITKTIIPINENGGKNLHKVLSQINPDILFQKIFIDDLKELFYTTSETINTIITSLGKNKNENEQAIRELELSLEAIISKRDLLIDEAKEKYSDVNIIRIIDNIGKEISNNIEELVNTAINSGQEALSAKISEIVRTALIENINSTMTDIGNDIINILHENLSNLSNSFSSFAISDEFIKRITEQTRVLLNKIQGNINDFRLKSNGKVIYKVLTTIFAVTTSVINPIIELVIIFLPDILNGFMKNYQKRKQEEAIRNAILTLVVPSIKRKLRNILPKIFDEQVKKLINDISNQFESEIAQKKEDIQQAQNEIKTKITDIESKITLYKSTLNEINKITNMVLFT